MLDLTVTLKTILMTAAVFLGVSLSPATSKTRADPPGATSQAAAEGKEPPLQYETERQRWRKRDAVIEDLKEQVLDLKGDWWTYEHAINRTERNGETEKNQEYTGKQVEVKSRLEPLELELDRLIAERRQEAEHRELLAMTDLFEYVASWRDVAFDSPQAVIMGIQAIVELHLGYRNAAGAADVLEELLPDVKETGARTAIHFALKDIHNELGDKDRALEHMIEVILENAGQIAE